MLREKSEQSRSRAKVQIFATDIDEAALGVARTGRYPDTLLQGVSKERLERFFTSEGTSYVINKPIRDMCVFSSHSVVRDPPFSRMDLISCRNLLIYLNRELQGHVIPIFHYALKPSGFLFLGTSENISQHGDLFTSLDKKNRVFQRREDGVAMPALPVLFRRHATGSGSSAEIKGPRTGSLRQAIETRVLERYAPPHVVVTREGDVINYSAGTGKYLEPPPGRPSRALMAMARKGLRLALRSATRRSNHGARRCATTSNCNGPIQPNSSGFRSNLCGRTITNRSISSYSAIRAPRPRKRSLRTSAARERRATRTLSNSSASCGTRASGCSRWRRNTRPRSRNSS